MISRKSRYYLDLICVLVAKEFRIRYKSTFLGYVWSVLQPLAFALVFYAVFKIVLRIPMNNFALYLITGLFPWQWFNNSIMASNGFFVGNSSLIKKLRFPRAFLVLAGVLNDLIHFLISIPVILIFMVWHHRYPYFSWLWLLPMLVLVQFLLTYGLSLLVATCNLFFRDLERLMMIFTLLWFYLTPVFYPVDMVPERYRTVYLFVNPMASLVTCWRSLFLSQPVSSLLRVADVREPDRLAARLRDPDDPLARHFQKSKIFGEGTLRLLTDGAPAERVVRAAVQDWNRAFPERVLYDRTAFEGVPLTRDTLKLLREKPIGWDLAYLNRRLLEAAYPKELTKAPVFSYLVSLGGLGWALLAWLVGFRVYKSMEWRFAESV